MLRELAILAGAASGRPLRRIVAAVFSRARLLSALEKNAGRPAFAVLCFYFSASWEPCRWHIDPVSTDENVLRYHGTRTVQQCAFLRIGSRHYPPRFLFFPEQDQSRLAFGFTCGVREVVRLTAWL